jgi:hypothetical protein
MKELLQILLGFVAVAAFIWPYLRLSWLLEMLGMRFFGPSFRWRRESAPRVKIQTLFHGNIKDDKGQI